MEKLIALLLLISAFIVGLSKFKDSVKSIFLDLKKLLFKEKPSVLIYVHNDGNRIRIIGTDGNDWKNPIKIDDVYSHDAGIEAVYFYLSCKFPGYVLNRRGTFARLKNGSLYITTFSEPKQPLEKHPTTYGEKGRIIKVELEDRFDVMLYVPHEIINKNKVKKWFDIFELTTKEGSTINVIFDITNFFYTDFSPRAKEMTDYLLNRTIKKSDDEIIILDNSDEIPARRMKGEPFEPWLPYKK